MQNNNIGEYCSEWEQKDREHFSPIIEAFPNMCRGFIWSEDNTKVDGVSGTLANERFFWELKSRKVDFQTFKDMFIEKGKVETAEKVYQAGDRLMYVCILEDRFLLYDMASIVGDDEYRTTLWKTNHLERVRQYRKDGTYYWKWGWRMNLPKEWATVISRDTCEILRFPKIRNVSVTGHNGRWTGTLNQETLEDYLCNSTQSLP